LPIGLAEFFVFGLERVGASALRQERRFELGDANSKLVRGQILTCALELHKP
jgi:hypothetical protein